MKKILMGLDPEMSGRMQHYFDKIY